MVPYNWSGVVTPSKVIWGFSPASQAYSNVTADQANQDYIGYTYGGGDGSVENPYQIAEPEQLIYVMSQHPEDWGRNFILTADINLALADPNTFTTAVIAPDGSPSFTGVFDGNGHTISNLKIDTAGASNYYLGLFGRISGANAEVKNLGLKNANITGGDNFDCLGGLCGYNYYGSISNCYASGSVTGGDGSRGLGGLCGASREGSISNCYASGSVTGGDNSFYLGGLCGYNESGDISNCYSSGSVTGGNDSESLGGLCGWNLSGNITYCYSIGSVTGGNGSPDLGGLCGYDSDGDISHCYFLDTAGPYNGYGQPLSDPNMMIQSSFVGWDFVRTWWIDQGQGYPHLQPYQEPTYLGTGTMEDPFQISTAQHLHEAGRCYLHWDKHFILTADLNMNLADPNFFTIALIAPDMDNSTSDFQGTSFTGVFDGNGHAICNLSIDDPNTGNDYLGLFGQIEGSNAQLKNLNMENVSITGGVDSDYLGALCGSNFYYGNISNCSSTGSVTGGDNSDYLGSLCGWNYRGNISNCYAIGSVTGGDNSLCLGGLFGESYKSNIANCSSTVSVTGGDGSNYLGGLCGKNGSFYSQGFINCYATGSVTGGDNADHLGGLCGVNEAGSISNCYATGAVTGGDNADYLGGLCGRNRYGNIINSYFTGSVTGGNGSTYLGGLSGVNFGDISSSYFLDTAGPDNGCGTPLPDPNMRIQASFANWDFVGEETNGTDDPWQLCIDGYDYPRLTWQFINPADFLYPGHVDNYDLFVLTQDWLSIDSRCCDIAPAPDGDSDVNLLDYAEFSQYWLME